MPYPGPPQASLSHHASEEARRLTAELAQRGLRVADDAVVVRAVYALGLPYEVAMTGRSTGVGLLVQLPRPQVWVEPWASDLFRAVHEVLPWVKGPRLDDTSVRNLLRWGATIAPKERGVALCELVEDLRSILAVGGDTAAAKAVVKALSKPSRAARNPLP